MMKKYRLTHNILVDIIIHYVLASAHSISDLMLLPTSISLFMTKITSILNAKYSILELKVLISIVSDIYG